VSAVSVLDSSHPTGVEPTGLLDDEELSIVQGVARRYFGFELTPDKRTMLSRRLRLFAKSEGIATVGGAVRQKLVTPTKEVLLKLAVYLTTNHTYFHREHQHFDRLLSDVLPALMRQFEDDKELRIWCAAASTGQEPYELAMCLADALGEEGHWKKAVLATDISGKVLATAKAANYSGEQVATLPIGRLREYMIKQTDSSFTVSAGIQELVTFRRLNLIRDSYPFRRRFQVIFCRNVMIYFAASVRMEVLKKLSDSLVNGGHLFIGRSESARGMDKTLEFVESGLYKKVRD
jgi:chemotaxis protein methyltransferase CheR